ncbi:MAG: glycosyltransferase family 9 protein [Bacteroidota bacterium]
MPKKADHKNILVIRLSAMGDVAMTVPVLLALTRRYPGLHITVATKAHNAPIFTALMNVSVIPVRVTKEHKGILGLLRLYKQLRKTPFDAVVDLHHVLRSNLLVTLFKLSGIRTAQLNKGRKEKKRLTRSRNKVFRSLPHTTERYAAVFSKLGLAAKPGTSNFLPRIPLSQKMISQLGETSSIKIGVAPFAAHSSKMYDLKLMEDVIRSVMDGVDCTILLFGGGKKEVNELENMGLTMGSKVISLAGKVRFAEELAVISNLDLMLAMDSGNGHLAANYGVPVVTIWGVTHPFAGFSPYRQPIENALLPDRSIFPLIPTSVYGNTYPESYKNAINSIPPGAIVEKIKEVLNRNSGN